jgi:glycine oxidase
VRGQLLRLRDPGGPGLSRRALRFEGGYLLSRDDGRYVLGATVEERGFALSATVGGIYELLREAHELVPGVAELEVEELCVGLRPGTPDNAPLIGPGAIAGLTWATGHYRSGILLAPLTAALVADLLAPVSGADKGGGAREDARLVAACAPDRFTGGAADGDRAALAANAGGAA